jgi:hypothetical protein
MAQSAPIVDVPLRLYRFFTPVANWVRGLTGKARAFNSTPADASISSRLDKRNVPLTVLYLRDSAS